MQYRTFGNSDVEVSVVGLGTWPFARDYSGQVTSQETVNAVVAEALDHGINLIDTAPAYGPDFEVERALGTAIKGKRDKVVLSTKCGVHRQLGGGDYAISGEYVRCLSPFVVQKELENSLKRLGTDYIDLYFLHWPDLNFGNEAALELLKQWKKEGKIRAGAVSNFSIEQTKIAIERGEISGIQPQLSLLARGSVTDGTIPFAAEQGLGIMTYGTLSGSILTGIAAKPPANTQAIQHLFYSGFDANQWEAGNRFLETLRDIASARNASVAEVSINWVLAQPGVSSALVGAVNTDYIAENARAADWSLTSEELEYIESSYQKNFN